MTGAFLVTEADGSQAIWPNVRNPSGFCSAMAKTGRRVRAATAEEVEASGIDDRITASAGAVAIQAAPADPVFDLVADMRARCGLGERKPAAASTKTQAIARAVDIMAGAA